MKKHGIGSHTRPNDGLSVEWLTPPEIVKAVGPFDLDPCCPKVRPWDTAKEHYSEAGLTMPWRGMVWMNPPYGTQTGRWLQRLADHGNGIALVFARTETRMFQHHVWPVATGLFFIYGRPHFYRPDGTRAKGNSGGPVMLVAYGGEAEYRLRHCKIPGYFLSLNK